MEQFRIEIRYDGIDAGDNVIDMRLFGESLIGLERALSTGLNAIAHGAIPRSRAKPTLEIKASPVRPGSVELDAIVEIAKGALPLITPFLIQHGPKIARLLISAIVKGALGRKSSRRRMWISWLNWPRSTQPIKLASANSYSILWIALLLLPAQSWPQSDEVARPYKYRMAHTRPRWTSPWRKLCALRQS